MTLATRLKTKRSRSLNSSPGTREKLRLWLRLLRTTRSIEAELRRRLRTQFGITMPRFDVMAALARSPGGMTMTELSRVLVVSNGNVTGIIDGLVADRLVMRIPAPEDRRATFVRLTPTGARQFEAMAATHAGWIEDMFADLELDDVASTMSTLARLRPRPHQEGPAS